jgi:hypothetical protein
MRNDTIESDTKKNEPRSRRYFPKSHRLESDMRTCSQVFHPTRAPLGTGKKESGRGGGFHKLRRNKNSLQNRSLASAKKFRGVGRTENPTRPRPLAQK